MSRVRRFEGGVSMVWKGHDLRCKVKAYYDPGRTNCANEDAYPPESEFEVLEVWMQGKRRERQLSNELVASLNDDLDFIEAAWEAIDEQGG